MTRRVLRRFGVPLLALAAAVLPSVPAARSAAQEPPVAPAPAPALAPVEPGVDLVVPTVDAEGATLYALAPVAARLGGRLAAQVGGGWSLTFGGEEVLFGPDSGALAIGTEITPLSRQPQMVDGSIYVPLDFLSVVYGRFGDIRLRADPATGTLTAVRHRARSLEVTTDVVHLQGVTTVVLQFPERPDYRVEQHAGRVLVALSGDRVTAARSRPVRDPLVSAIDVRPDRIVVELVPGATADSYTLENPFRLVFDVHRGGVAERPLAPAPEPPEPPEGLHTIVIDPGHGGTETGAIGPSGVEEKNLTLLIAQTLKAQLEAALPVRVVLTRGEDANLPLETRTAIANQNKADLFVSLHLNSAFGPAPRGAETYFLSATASDERAAQAAAAENAPGGAARPAAGGDAGGEDALYDLRLILWDLAQSHFLAESQRLGNLIQGELNGALDLRDRGVKQAPFVVLMGAAMPAVLVELGFLSNPEEERRLQDPSYRGQLAAALVRAISRYRDEVEGAAAGVASGATGPAAGAASGPPAAGGDGR